MSINDEDTINTNVVEIASHAGNSKFREYFDDSKSSSLNL
jgi:hypothetical protein